MSYVNLSIYLWPPNCRTANFNQMDEIKVFHWIYEFWHNGLMLGKEPKSNYNSFNSSEEFIDTPLIILLKQREAGRWICIYVWQSHQEHTCVCPTSCFIIYTNFVLPLCYKWTVSFYVIMCIINGMYVICWASFMCLGHCCQIKKLIREKKKCENQIPEISHSATSLRHYPNLWSGFGKQEAVGTLRGRVSFITMFLM